MSTSALTISGALKQAWTDEELQKQFEDKNSPLSALETVRGTMAWINERLYVAVPTGVATANDRLLVYDTQHQWWTIHDIPASALVPFRRSDREELTFGYATGPNRVGSHYQGLVTDRGNVITSRWRSGWSDYGQPIEKTMRETKVWGSGACLVAFSVDFNSGQTASQEAAFSFSGT